MFDLMDALPVELRVEARRLRKVDGLSLASIASLLGISTTTVRRWTLDISLSRHQLKAIERERLAASLRGSHLMAAGCRDVRLRHQQEGRARAKQLDPLHMAGCMLYWAEGTKGRNRLSLANSDMNLMWLYRRFLSESLDVTVSRMTFRLHVYTGNGLSIRQVENRWLDVLELPRSCLRSHSVNRRPAATSGVKCNKLPYGVGTLSVLRSTPLVQHIYGAIQEYGGFDEAAWLN